MWIRAAIVEKAVSEGNAADDDVKIELKQNIYWITKPHERIKARWCVNCCLITHYLYGLFYFHLRSVPTTFTIREKKFPPPEIYCVLITQQGEAARLFLGVILFFFLWRAVQRIVYTFFLNAPFCFERWWKQHFEYPCDKIPDKGTEGPRPPAAADKGSRKKKSCTLEPPTNAQNVGAEKMWFSCCIKSRRMFTRREEKKHRMGDRKKNLFFESSSSRRIHCRASQTEGEKKINKSSFRALHSSNDNKNKRNSKKFSFWEYPDA